MIGRIRNHFLFKEVPEDIVKALLAHGDVKSAAFEGGDTICDPKHYLPSLGIVLAGTVEVYNSAGPHRVLLNVLPMGSTFGVATLFSDAQAYVSTIVAKGRCEVLFIPQDAIEELFSKSMQAVKNYIAFLAGRIQFLNRKIEGFTMDGATQRLAMYLVDHSDTDGKVTLPFGMNKLAAQLSIGRASLYRAEQVLVQKGLIERSGRVIHILSQELLSHIREEQS